MTEKIDSFTIQELEELSGFDRRTISYYVQQGLLTKVGKRGRGTLYPAAFKERLLFIRAIRNLQDAGDLRAVSLAEITELMQSTSTEDLVRLRNGPNAAESIRSLFSEPDWDTHGLATPVESITRGKGQGKGKSDNGASRNRRRSVTLNEVKTLIQEINSAACRPNSEKAEDVQRLVETTNIQIADNIMISVNNLSERHRKALINLANALSS